MKKEELDTAHYYYMREYLEKNMLDEKSLQRMVGSNNVNGIFFEIQELGHIVFAENTSSDKCKSGIIYMPNELSDKQRESLKGMMQKFKDEEYNLIKLYDLKRDEDGTLLGKQKQGMAEILKEDVKEEQER